MRTFKCYLQTFWSSRLKSRFALVRLPTSTQLVPLNVTLEEPLHGGYAGVRVGEVQNPRPAAHERNRAEERCARRTRINETGDAAPGSQISITRGAQNLQRSGTVATLTTRTTPAPRRCPILEDPLNRGHDKHGIIFAVLSLVLIQKST